ncbi:MAG TPA: S8 family serine peptidase [Pyrinomonadaceae bacterium]|nr:S8 family serine peptidase [Pyrinomonadaceae bacterium]
MKKLLVVAVVMTVVTLAFVSNVGRSARAENTKGNKMEPVSDFVRGRLLVKFNDNIGRDHARQVIAALGARDADEIPNIGVHILDLPYGASEQAFMNAFHGRPEVEFAELDRIVQPAEVVPNDPWYGSWQWHLSKISASSAWAQSTGSPEVTIAILDTGVDTTHPDLVNKLVPGWNVYDNNSVAADVNGHGTNVAGAAAAQTDNGLGVAAVCWACKIMPVRISDAVGNASYSAMASGLDWAANHGARVANISYIASGSATVRSAAQYFQSKGGVVTSSAGNYSTFDSAGDNPYILTISASDINDAPSSFSNYGNNIDVAAPEGGYTTAKGGGYAYAGGTSFASPVVAGLVALVFSVNPTLTPAQVQDLVRQNADDLGPAGWDIHYGWGRVNAAATLCAANGGTCTPPTPTPSPTPVPSPSATPLPTPLPTPAPTPMPIADTTAPSVSITSPVNGAKVSANVSVSVRATDNVSVVSNELYVDGQLVATSNMAPFTTKWNAKKAANGQHKIICKAYDAAHNVGVSQEVTVYK